MSKFVYFDVSLFVFYWNFGIKIFWYSLFTRNSVMRVLTKRLDPKMQKLFLQMYTKIPVRNILVYLDRKFRNFVVVLCHF